MRPSRPLLGAHPIAAAVMEAALSLEGTSLASAGSGTWGRPSPNIKAEQGHSGRDGPCPHRAL